jgi:uncharacterized protein (DUF1697 family)
MTKYVAFLRGINVGGNKKVPMAKLKIAFGELGFKNIRTVLASGNVVFEGKKGNLVALAEKIALALEKRFGFTIPVIIREVDEIEKTVESDPFKGVAVTKETRLYLTFLSEKPNSTMKIPYTTSDKSFSIISLEDKTIFSALDLSKAGTTDAMAIIEREFGKNITTRNWNTIVKIIQK